MKKCRMCGKEMKKCESSRHSPVSHHLPPYIDLCKECHRMLHSNKNWAYTKLNQQWIKEYEEND